MLVVPGDVLWVDVIVPAGDPVWDDDVSHASHWLGDAWADALGALGIEGGRVHRGGLVVTEWSRLVCFAGLGPGEVTSAGRKVVGISQRRTRDGVRFQCAVALRWEIGRLAGLLALDAAQRARLVADLETAVAPVPQPADQVVEELLRALSRLT